MLFCGVCIYWYSQYQVCKTLGYVCPMAGTSLFGAHGPYHTTIDSIHVSQP